MILCAIPRHNVKLHDIVPTDNMFKSVSLLYIDASGCFFLI